MKLHESPIQFLCCLYRFISLGVELFIFSLSLGSKINCTGRMQYTGSFLLREIVPTYLESTYLRPAAMSLNPLVTNSTRREPLEVPSSRRSV